MLVQDNPLGPGYGLQLNSDNDHVESPFDWKGTILPIIVAFFVVIFFSWTMVLVEAQFVNQSAQAQEVGNIKCSNLSVSKQVYSGYIGENVYLRESFFACGHYKEEKVSWWKKILGVKEALAAEYGAFKMLESDKFLEMKPGETKKFTIGFKNTGSTPWYRDSGPYISIYTYDPKYRTSQFQDSSWKLREQPAKMVQAEVAPGQIGFITWTLHAPSNISPGWYTETFNLAAEDTAWIPGGQFSIKILIDGEAVSEPQPVEAEINSTHNSSTEASSVGYSAKLLLRSHQSVRANAGQTIEFTAGFKNYGSTTWTNEKIILPDVTTASSGLDDFYHSSWSSQSEVSNYSKEIAPGGLGFFKFIFTAPQKAGDYDVNFNLNANGINVPGGTIYIPVTVTNDGSAVTSNNSSSNYGDEPTMRIGLFDLEDDLELTADKSFKVLTSCGDNLGTYSAGEIVVAGWDKSVNQYYFTKGATSYRGSCYLRFEPVSGQNIFELTNYEHRPAWNRSLNDNKFRGIMEIRVSETGYPWAINELPMEDYLKGLAETSNYSPLEFQKALITAARSYAFHHWENPYKHAKGHFTLDATYDQVYRGYGNEVRVPKLSQASDETRGMIVHYDGEAVFTPYYSRSDGRTRSYKEVWGIYNGQDYGWLQAVPAPYDAENKNTLWGHGVGMACTDAIGMANDNYNWEEILKHYYTSINLKKLW